jgi:hypothetical protein
MYCPNCGCENNKNQNFCRYCGFNLTATAKSLRLQRAFGEKAYRLKKSDKIKRSMNQVSEILIIGFFFGLLSVFLLDAGKIGAFLKVSIGVYLAFQGVVRIIDYLQRAETKKNALVKTEEDRAEQREMESPETRRLIEERPFAPAAVTEISTELLFVENKTRKFE